MNMKKIAALLMAVLLIAGSAFAYAEGAVDTIMNAKTTQAFAQDPVAEEDLNTILQAGTMATSAINQQPWYFAVITNEDVMNEIASSAGFGGMPAGMPGMPEGGMPEGMPEKPAGGMQMGGSGAAKAALGDSPVAIVIYMNENTSSPNASFDCGLATQNMVIAANALGYGTKIISSPTMSLNGENHDALCEKLGVDPSYSAVAVLLIGVADAEVDGATGATTHSPLEEKVSIVE